MPVVITDTGLALSIVRDRQAGSRDPRPRLSNQTHGGTEVSRTEQAVRLVLEKGVSQYAAAKALGIDKAAVCRALGKLTEVKTCPCCGQPKRELKQ